ncbi:MAG: hypothetical protein C4542_00455 [Dehalococcoidia bacterium]|nr:MAG: hypothetical protein C4542_00455 [Dehalococcoidia bacterium]
MARFASEAKGGYYPTPPRQMELVCSRLAVEPGSIVNLFDPCAGEGAALRQMAEDLRAKGARPVTYGIELEVARAEKAKTALDHAAACGYESIRMTNGAISAMWLNPPYSTKDGKRVETNFLRDLTDKRLQPGGLLMYCIPQTVLEDSAYLLVSRFENMSVYRFTDDDYPVYKQVVVFGYRRAKPNAGPEARTERETLVGLARGGPDVLLPLDAGDGKTFTVPPSEKPVDLFRDSQVDADEVMAEMLKSRLFEKAEDCFLPPSANRSRVKIKTPILPLKPAHVGIAIASGAAGGNLGTHIVVGATKKVTETYEENENVTIRIDRYVPSVKIYSPQGIFSI